MFFVVLVSIVFGSQGALAQQPSCQLPLKSATDVLICAETRSPEVQKALLEFELAKAQIGAAEQWRNPELSVDSVSGFEGRSETGVNLGIPIELGGKIDARRNVAKSGATKADAALYATKSEVRSNVLLKLHRLRQLTHEQEVIDESIDTFTKLVKQYGQRLQLSPEQEISVTVFKMSKSEYELKKSELLAEKNSLEAYFQTVLGVGIADLQGAVPKSPKNWPALPASSEISNSPKLKMTSAEIERAKADLSLAGSEAWPTMILGPSIKMQNESGKSNQLYGFNLSLPLPIFNANGKGKAAAASGLRVAETAHQLAQVDLQKTREHLAKTYQQSVTVLGTTVSHEEIEKKHDSIEKLFFRGVVPSSLVIEAHRTYVDLEKTRNERELKTLEALFAIYTFDGKLLEAQP